MYVTGTLIPKYGGAAAFTTAAFFQELWLFCGIISAIAACMAVIALRRKDRTEFFGTGQAQKIGFTTTQPTQDTPYSAGIFWVTMACFIGAPMVDTLFHA